MSKDDYRIWSNADLDYEEWKDWMEEEYPTLSEDERVAMMKQLNDAHNMKPPLSL